MHTINVDLWTVRLTDLELYRKTLIGRLSQQEWQRSYGLKSATRRREFLLTRGFVRSVLAEYSGSDPAGLNVIVSDQGKPKLLPTSGRPPIAFNVSHSHGSVALVLCDGASVGVDIERKRPMSNARAIADQYFTRSECGRLDAETEAAARASLFLRFWTRKEALMKAHGGGLAIGADTFDVDFGPPPVGGVCRMVEGRQFALADCDAVPDCHASVAVEGDALTVGIRDASTALARL